MNRLAKLTLLCLLLSTPYCVWGQNRSSITLDECHELAVEISSLEQRRDIATEIALSEKKEAGSTYIPSAALNGLVSYQSDVVQIPIPIIEPPLKELYRVTIDVEQFIYDGGVSSKTKKISAANLKSEQLKLDIERLSIKDNVSNLFLNIELLKKNRGITLLQIEIITTSLENLYALEKNGAATKSDILKLETELLQQQKQLIEIEANRAKIVEMLSIMTHTTLSTDTEYIMPSYEFTTTEVSNRPEFKLYDAQSETLELRKKLSQSDNVPKMSAFVTGGNGLPGLNMLATTSQWYYVVGAKFTVPLTNWIRTKHTVKKYNFQQQRLMAEKSDFERNNKIAISANINEINKFRELIISDKEIVAKEQESLQIEQQKLKNGITTTTDYITELNGYRSALLAQSLNEVKLIEAVVNYKSNIGE